MINGFIAPIPKIVKLASFLVLNMTVPVFLIFQRCTIDPANASVAEYSALGCSDRITGSCTPACKPASLTIGVPYSEFGRCS